MEPQTEKIELDSLIAAKLRERAAAQGITLEELLRPLAEGSNGAKKAALPEMTPEQRAKAFEEWASSHDPKTPVIPDDSREVIYEDDDH
jgi:hypothetical protein